MFLFNLTYMKPLEEIDRLMEGHLAYLEKNYAAGKFVFSGRKTPRVGGVILCNAKDMAEAVSIMREDPFFQEKAALYDVIAFTPTKYAEGFEKFLEEEAIE